MRLAWNLANPGHNDAVCASFNKSICNFTNRDLLDFNNLKKNINLKL